MNIRSIITISAEGLTLCRQRKKYGEWQKDRKTDASMDLKDNQPESSDCSPIPPQPKMWFIISAWWKYSLLRVSGPGFIDFMLTKLCELCTLRVQCASEGWGEEGGR